MASPFKIPKKKQPAGSDSSHLHSQSPLSRLQSPAPEFKGYGHQSSRGRADRMHAGNALGSSTSRQRDYVKSLLGLNSPNRGAPTANRRAPGSCGRQSQPGQRAQSSSGCVSNGWRPKRASDRLLPPDEASEPLTPPQKKKSDLRGPPLSSKNISVESLDYLAELRGEEHAGSLSSPTQKRGTWRRVDTDEDAADEKSDSGSSPESLKQQQKSSVSGSDQTSEDDFVSPPRAGNKPLHKDVRRPCCAPRSTPDTRRGLNRTSWLVASNNLMEDLREKEREKWRAFREKKTANRSAVLQLRLRKPKAAEPIVLSSEEEEEGEDDADGGKRTLQSSSLLDESHLGKPERMQVGDTPEGQHKGSTQGYDPGPCVKPLQILVISAEKDKLQT